MHSINHCVSHLRTTFTSRPSTTCTTTSVGNASSRLYLQTMKTSHCDAIRFMRPSILPSLSELTIKLIAVYCAALIPSSSLKHCFCLNKIGVVELYCARVGDDVKYKCIQSLQVCRRMYINTFVLIVCAQFCSKHTMSIVIGIFITNSLSTKQWWNLSSTSILVKTEQSLIYYLFHWDNETHEGFHNNSIYCLNTGSSKHEKKDKSQWASES